MSGNNDKDIMDAQDFKGPSYDNPIQRIKVIGVGGGGNNAVIHMHRRGIKDVSFVLLNTDRQVLDSADVPNKVLIGPGRGAGGKPERAKKYAEESAEQIADLFDDETDMVFITAGMGGGTGTGAAPVVARIAKEKGILTVGIVTVPFLFEGEKKIIKAMEGVEAMAKNVDSLLVINNQRLNEIYKNLNIFNAFAKADDTLLNAAQSITDIITIRGTINRDFNDVDTTLREGGTAVISTGYGEGPNRVTEAIQDALHSPLLNNTDIFGSKKLLMVLYVSDDPDNHPFNMEETKALEDFVDGIVEDVDVMWGLYQQPGLDEKVRITILASGFETTIKRQIGQPHEPIQRDPGEKTDDSREPINKRFKGIVLDPSAYDDPNPQLEELESTPAIERSPSRNFRNGNQRSFQSPGSSQTEKKNSSTQQESKQNKDDENPSGGLLLTFDDF